MTIPALGIVVITALATNPLCGAARPGSDLANRLVATAMTESHGEPYAIGVNGPGGGAHHFETAAAAISYGHMLDAAGVDWDGGVMQINRRNFVRHGLTVETVFDACRNMAAASAHLAEDFRQAWNSTSRRYNCGRFDCGIAYADKVDATASGIDGDPRPSVADKPNPIPPFRDALHEADSGLTDLFVHQKKDQPQ